ncbi:MAG TPA: hypothetical protein VMG55_06440 [Stellaceae bacterium]|nr:hypothetical protein [Stellaceae bacterium]
MVDQQSNGASGVGARVARALWLGAGGILLTGFAMRVLAGLVHSQTLRHGGVAVMALGVALAIGAGLSEWLGNRHAHH